MIKTNSIYTLNKKDPNAIVYNTSFGAACPERTAKNTKRQGANALCLRAYRFREITERTEQARQESGVLALSFFASPDILKSGMFSA